MTHTFRICRSGRPKENVVCPKKTWHFSEEALSLSDHTTGRPAGYVYPSDRRPLVTTYSLVANMFLKWIHISIRTICVPHQDLIYVQFYCYQYSMLHCRLGSECFPKIFPFAYGSCIWRGVCVCECMCGYVEGSYHYSYKLFKGKHKSCFWQSQWYWSTLRLSLL